MKRLIWLLLAVFSTALAQVQPVTLPVLPEDNCGCCDAQSGCDMPDCAMPPAPTLAQLAPPVTSVRLESRRAAQPARRATRFYTHFVPTPSRLVVPVASVPTAPAAQVPLFVAHCSYRI